MSIHARFPKQIVTIASVSLLGTVAADEIVRVVLRTDNRFGQGTWATWNSLPVVEFELER